MRFTVGRPKKVFFVCLGSLSAGALMSPFQNLVFAQGGRRFDGWHPMMGGWGMGGLGFVFTILFWVLAVALIVWLARLLFKNTGRDGDGRQSRSAALDILDERYARGEIDKSRYESMKKDILAR